MPRIIPFLLLSCIFAVSIGLNYIPAGDKFPPDPYADRLPKASDEGLKAMQAIQAPAGIKIEQWAAEPLLANPVSFCFDEKGRCYVAETFRVMKGVTDDRFNMFWLDDDLATQTVADRVAVYKKWESKKSFSWYSGEHDRVRLLEDTKGTGKADKATVFSDGYNRPEDGIGAGLFAWRGKVWYTCIPDLYVLQDTKGTGRADVKQSLSTGYGVRISFFGHDLHGLRMGPDGKIYFSIGDRGLNVTTKEGKHLINVDCGAVLRCYPDGTDLEIVHTGLRNPQELAFDDYGNLFAGDNNADGGDSARLVHIVEGGDSGWRIGYQYLGNSDLDPHRKLPPLGPWLEENLWRTSESNTAAYIVPPIAPGPEGPSGLTHNPGVTLWPDIYKGYFFLCDFHGSPSGSRIWALTFEPKGASFAAVDLKRVIHNTLASDCDFGPDGSLYFTDWVDGWEGINKGRIYKAYDPKKLNDPAVAEVKQLLAEGFTQRPTEELTKLLEHRDQRIRQEAQFALAERPNAAGNLAVVVEKGGLLARLHAIWALGQMLHRGNPDAFSILSKHANDKEAEVRAQVFKVLGDNRVGAPSLFAPGLEDSQPRVRFFAALGMGKTKSGDAGPALLGYLKRNADKDPFERHAAVTGLVNIEDRKGLIKAASDPSPSARLGVLLAMRRLGMEEVSGFLKDPVPHIVLEAARAINDEPIVNAMPHLAALAADPAQAAGLPANLRDFVLRRALNAQNYLGKKENAQILVNFALRDDISELARVEALSFLLEWERPVGRDHIVGLWRPLAPRPAQDVAEVARAALPRLLSKEGRAKELAVKLAGSLGIADLAPSLRAMVADQNLPVASRVESLKALAAMKESGATAVADLALKDAQPRLRNEARRILLQGASPDKVAAELAKVIDGGDLLERQYALTLLAKLPSPPAQDLLSKQMRLLLDNKIPAELRLDILEAARQDTDKYKDLLDRYQTSLSKTDALAPYRESLIGGDPEGGKAIFFNVGRVQCIRCHKLGGVGTSEVGPDLTGIGKREKRDYILESIVDPNAKISKGFETAVLTLTNGKVVSGIVKAQDAKEVRLLDADGRTLIVPTADIEERSTGRSAMPDDMRLVLSARELRDLVEFLARQ